MTLSPARAGTGRGRVPAVAIVGGGASGSLTAVHLLRRATASGVPLRVALIDRDGRHGMGQAYATADPRHLLNAGAATMSALADDPGHLRRWTRRTGLEPAGPESAGPAFIPRGEYGRYLRELLDDVAGRVLPGGRLARLTGTVTALTRPDPYGPVRVHLANGGRIDADAVVLATGNRPPAAGPATAPGRRHIADPWAPGALVPLHDGAPVLILGTGLTMVDVAISVLGAHPDTVVYAVSRHGLLPRRHRCTPAPPVEAPIPEGELRLSGLLAAVRTAVTAAGGDWHGVVDALRPRVPSLWARLGVEDRRRFLALVARYWEVHRHRIPPATADRIEGFRAAGRLRLLRGRLLSAAPGPDEVTVRLAEDGGERELRVGWFVNGTGPAADVGGDPLLRGLIAAGLARPDPLRLGLDADETGAVLDGAGRPHERIFALGPPLRGLRYETTAIPEIRAQAAALAPRVLHAVASAPVPAQAGPAARTPAAHRGGAPATGARAPAT
ncbi:FAD/NAD(P)-binding protein [Actinoallomurus sp. NBC_01490]|uniref:FAD/NAD(P)-binding protein n=1 Tax=Actinoallomurus sp. NBC_01490 TaxID=2903557 RepID=UPI002E35F8F4|nr:FAD/NAD(P)-binding protein [Actinoallomurus sp. NBC_01490]